MINVGLRQSSAAYVDADLACNTLQLESERGRVTVGEMRRLADAATESLTEYRRVYRATTDPARKVLVQQAASIWEGIVAVLATILQKDADPLTPGAAARLCPWIVQAGELLRGEAAGRPLQAAAEAVLTRYHGPSPAPRKRVGLSPAGKVVVGLCAAALAVTGIYAVVEWRKEA